MDALNFLGGVVDHVARESDSILLTLLAAHAVNSFPVPDNKYARWLLGCIQWVFAFRGRAQNTFQNADTVTVPIAKGTGDGQLPVKP